MHSHLWKIRPCFCRAQRSQHHNLKIGKTVYLNRSFEVSFFKSINNVFCASHLKLFVTVFKCAISRLNNRKAKLARIAKERAENADKPSTPHPGESSESAGEDNYLPPAGVMTALSKGGSLLSRDSTEQTLQAELSPNTTMMVRPFTRSFSLEPGRLVSLVDSDGKEVGRGMIFQVPGKCPTESCVCVVDVADLRTEKWRELPHPSEAFGWTFQEAEARNGGIIRVSWDAVRLFPVA
jgi:hypothetical protein